MKMKTCALCGKLFEPRSNPQKICDDTHYRNCVVCGTPFVVPRPSYTKQTCSNKKCVEKLREMTMISRYGKPFSQQIDSMKEKSKQTNLEKFGVEHAAQSSEIKAKMKSTNLERYGAETPFTASDFQEKSKQTCLRKYGVEYTSQIPGRTAKMQATNIKRYGAVAPMCNSDIQKKFSDDMMHKYGVPYYCMTDECRSMQKQTISSLNRKFHDMLLESGIDSTYEFSIDRYSYDLCIEDMKILIEIDPSDTHNTVCTPWSNHTSITKDYHLIKTMTAFNKGYRCIHVFDWDDWNKVINLLKSHTKVYARECTIKRIDSKTANEFETLYHLQGKCNGQQYCYGLYFNTMLVQVMTFGNSRYDKSYEYELLRLCTHSDYYIVGGAERLFAYFKKWVKPDSVISYCDFSKFTGDVYKRLGMSLLRATDPNLIWIKGKKKITSNLLRSKGYDALFGTQFGKGTSNEQLMLNTGWLPVYDCGQSVYGWKNR